MKNILIAAAIVGAATAGAILYLKSRNEDDGTKRIKGAARKAYKTMNGGIGRIERTGQHSMG